MTCNDYKSVALPTELCRHKKTKIFQINFIQINTIILKSSYHATTSYHQLVTGGILFSQSDILRDIFKKLFVP